MRVNYALLLTAAVTFVSTSAASATTNSEVISNRETNIVSRFLRKHNTPAAKKQDDDDEDRALNLDMVANWFKLDSKKIDDLAPKMEIEMTNLKRLDDVVDTKKLDDVTDLKKLGGKTDDLSTEDMAKTFVDIFDSWKTKRFSVEQARQDMQKGGINDEGAMKEVLAWYVRYVVQVV